MCWRRAKFAAVYVALFAIGLGAGVLIRHQQVPAAVIGAREILGSAWGRPIQHINFHRQSVRELLSELGVASHAAIEIDPTANPDRLTQLDGDARNVQLGQVLPVLARTADTENDRFNSTFVRARNGRIYVAQGQSSPAMAPLLRAYDVRDLIARVAAYRAAHPDSMSDRMLNDWGSDYDWNEKPRPADASAMAIGEHLEQLIMGLQAYDLQNGFSGMWEQRGMVFSDGRLIVCTLPEVHEDIQALLAVLVRNLAGDDRHDIDTNLYHDHIIHPDFKALNIAASRDLDQKHSRLDIAPCTLEQAIESLRQTTGVNIFANWEHVKRIIKPPAKLLEFHRRDVMLRDALTELLDAVPTQNNQKLGFCVENGIITIPDSIGEATERSIVAFYDVSDLLPKYVAEVVAPMSAFGADEGIDPTDIAKELLIDGLQAKLSAAMPMDVAIWPYGLAVIGNVLRYDGLPKYRDVVEQSLHKIRETR